MFGGLYISERFEAFEKFSHPPTSDSFQAKRTQLRLFKEARRKTISSFYDGERRHRPKHSVKIKGNGCCNLHPPLDLKKERYSRHFLTMFHQMEVFAKTKATLVLH